MRVRDLTVMAQAETRLKGNGDKIIHEDFRHIYSEKDEGIPFLVAHDGMICKSERIINIDLNLENQRNSGVCFTAL